MIQNRRKPNFEVSAVIYFWVMLTTYKRHADKLLKCDFQIQGTSKRVNPSKSLFPKFDPKTILSQPCMGKWMLKKQLNKLMKMPKKQDVNLRADVELEKW